MVQQKNRIKDLFSLVGYDDSCLAALRLVKSIIHVIQPRPNIRCHSVLFMAGLFTGFLVEKCVACQNSVI